MKKTIKKKPSRTILKTLEEKVPQAKADLANFQKKCEMTQASQEEVLFSILQTNAKNLPHPLPSTVAEFQQQFPLVTYADIQEKLEDHYHSGNLDVEGNETIYYSKTAGTTSRHKLIPFTKKCWEFASKHNSNAFAYNLLNDSRFAQFKSIHIVPPSKLGESPQGLEQGHLSGYFAHDTAQKFTFSNVMPPEFIHGYDEEDRFHKMMLQSVESELSTIGSLTTYPVYHMLKTIWESWDTIKAELKAKGSINQRRLQRIELLSTDMEKTDFFAELWPNLHYCFCWCHSTAGLYKDKILEFLPNLNIRSTNYCSTEGIVNVSFHADYPQGAGPLCVDSLFYEFMEVNDSQQTLSDQTVLAHELVVGKRYELVITNWNHLYRYKQRDIIEVVGHDGSAPVVRFFSKTDQTLNAFRDRTSYYHFKTGFEQAFEHLSMNSSDQWLVAPVHTDTPHYLLFLPQESKPELSRQHRLDLVFDEYLRKQSYRYDTERASGAIHDLKVQFLPKEHILQKLGQNRKDSQSEGSFKPSPLFSDVNRILS